MAFTRPVRRWAEREGPLPPAAVPGSRLRAKDAFFLDVEVPSCPQHSCALLELRWDKPDPPSAAWIAGVFAERLGRDTEWARLVVARDRLGRPRWATDPRIAPKELVQVHDSSEASLADLVSQRLNIPFRPGEPLWRADVLQDGHEGRFSLVVSVHHSLFDGQGALAAARAIMDEGGADRGGAAPETGDVARSVTDRFASATQLARGTLGLARSGRAPQLAWRERGRRDFAFAGVEGAAIAEARKALGASNAELLVVAVAEAVAAQISQMGAPLPHHLRAMVALRGPARRKSSGNWNEAVPIDVPLEGELPQRLAQVRRSLHVARTNLEPQASSFVMSFIEAALPPGLRRPAARSAYNGRWFNFVVSIMAGSPRPLHLAGAEVRGLYPLLPLAPGAPLSLAAVAWAGRLCLGTTTDPGALAAGAITDQLRHTLAAGAGRGSPGEAIRP